MSHQVWYSVSKDRFDQAIKEYHNPTEWSYATICEPPITIWNDITIGQPVARIVWNRVADEVYHKFNPIKYPEIRADDYQLLSGVGHEEGS